VEIIVDVKDYSHLQVTAEDNYVRIDATHKESNECTTIEKHLSYRCAIKDKFESADVTSRLSSNRVLTVLIPKAVSGKIRQVPIEKTGHDSPYTT